MSAITAKGAVKLAVELILRHGNSVRDGKSLEAVLRKQMGAEAWAVLVGLSLAEVLSHLTIADVLMIARCCGDSSDG